MPSTLLLDQSSWDLVLDASGNIAMASNPYSLAQNVATAVRTFLGDVYFDVNQGIPYLENILGEQPNLMFIKTRVERAALSVAEVVKARCIFAKFSGRVLSGQVQVVDAAGAEHNVNF